MLSFDRRRGSALLGSRGSLSGNMYIAYKCRRLVMCIEDIEFAETPTYERHLVGRSALLQCVVSGLPRPQVSWRFNRQRISTGTSHLSSILQSRPPTCARIVRCHPARGLSGCGNVGAKTMKVGAVPGVGIDRPAGNTGNNCLGGG